MKVVTTFAEALNLALTRFREGDYVQAEVILRKLSQVKPDHPLITDHLIQVIFIRGNITEAMSLYDTAVRRGAHACDADYDAIYRDALLATNYCPAPLKRRGKFHSLLGLLARTLPLEGEAAECGCFRGLSSYLMLSKMRLHDPRFNGSGYHIFDSFQGLSTPTRPDEPADDHPQAEDLRYMCSQGSFAAPLEDVQRALAKFPGVAYHPGWIPASFDGLAERRYRFVHVDVDLHVPTRACLEYFYPRMVPNGIIVCDDYGWPGARLAVEEFCTGERIGFSVTPHDQATIVRS